MIAEIPETDQPFSLNPPVPLGASRLKIDQVAESIATRWGYQPGSSLHDWVANTLGGKVKTGSPESATEYGYLQVPGKSDQDSDQPSSLEITLSPFTGEFDDRFTIAHELGHYFLHCIAQDRHELIVKREGNDLSETEANWFAEAFLMPRNHFVEAWNETEGSIPSLIHRYKVAADVITLRYKSLKQLGENGFRYEGKWA